MAVAALRNVVEGAAHRHVQVTVVSENDRAPRGGPSAWGVGYENLLHVHQRHVLEATARQGGRVPSTPHWLRITEIHQPVLGESRVQCETHQSTQTLRMDYRYSGDRRRIDEAIAD